MSRSGTEKRRKTEIIGLRMEPSSYERLSAAAAARNMTPTALAREIIDQRFTGSAPASTVAARTVIVSAEEREILGSFTRHAGMLTGALVQAARNERTVRGYTPEHHQLEVLLAEVRAVNLAVDSIKKRIEK